MTMVHAKTEREKEDPEAADEPQVKIPQNIGLVVVEKNKNKPCEGTNCSESDMLELEIGHKRNARVLGIQNILVF